ncbi:hypothetical protein [Jiangella asiatica]|uniref:MFS transporter n=1 Tax=Jiangella asiatica TaxID=2530372 RepID=A0A4V6PFR0_9ACTN|nr:hypothetical protein [Jiangella asiatica]TDE13008.1 hypothetical protein E1269_06335 [Jiangella asiatica]
MTRGLVMAATCLLVPTAAHVAAGGAAPVQAGFLLPAALLCVACVALADRRRSAGEIAAVFLLSQPVLHVLLTLGGHGDEMTSVLPGPSMLVAHVVSATALTVLLAGAENVAWSLAALSATVLLTRVRRLLASPPLVGPARIIVDGARLAVVPRGVVLVRSTPWRGPPVPAGTC